MKIRQLFTLAALLTVLAGTLSSCGYNGMVNREEAIDSKWAQVESQYQRRADLIPNLVETVKGSANFEQETLNGVVEARSKVSSIQIDPKNMTQEDLDKFQAAQDQLSGALNRLMVVVERYPELKSTQAFQDLMIQLEGTENRISTERRNFNNAVQDYNSFIRRFPNNLTASMFGFEKHPYFQAQEGAENAPKVDFGKKQE